MLYTTPFFQKKTTLIAGGLLLFLCLATFCKNEPIDDTIDPIEDPIDTIPPASVWDTILGQHTGTCYYYYKNYATGAEEWDTTLNSILELAKASSDSTRVQQLQGCGLNPYYYFNPPENLDTVYHYSAYQVSQSHLWTIEINPFARTIVTKYSYYYPMNIREYTGRWEY